MQLRLKTLHDVRFFSAAITAVALCGNIVLQYLMLPPVIFEHFAFSSSVVTVMLSAPISFFIGLKVLDVNNLTMQLEHAVNHDSLTGTCTRLSFHRQLTQIKNEHLVMIVTDIDHFKRINDSYGHQAGDSALKQFAKSLLRNCRDGDVVARFGGEEFIILLRNASVEEGVEVAQRLCDRVRAETFAANGQQVRITASFGVAELGSNANVDEAIHRADLAAFRAKREGRDRVCQYDPGQDMVEPADKDIRHLGSGIDH